MKKKPISVTPTMKERIRAEMKRNHQTDQDIADILYITRQQYSRIINGKYNLIPEHLKKLLSVWGVRENYLLGKDNIRTEYDFFHKIGLKSSEEHTAVTNLLSVYGYNIESVYLLAVSALDLSRLYFMDEELAFISQHIVSHVDLWEIIAERARVMKNNREYDMELFDDKKYYFEISDSLAEKIKTENETLLENDILLYVDTLARIRKDGVLVGYVENTNSILKMIGDNAAQLFDLVININRKGVGYMYTKQEM